MNDKNVQKFLITIIRGWYSILLHWTRTILVTDNHAFGCREPAFQEHAIKAYKRYACLSMQVFTLTCTHTKWQTSKGGKREGEGGGGIMHAVYRGTFELFRQNLPAYLHSPGGERRQKLIAYLPEQQWNTVATAAHSRPLPGNQRHFRPSVTTVNHQRRGNANLHIHSAN